MKKGVIAGISIVLLVIIIWLTGIFIGAWEWSDPWGSDDMSGSFGRSVMINYEDGSSQSLNFINNAPLAQVTSEGKVVSSITYYLDVLVTGTIFTDCEIIMDEYQIKQQLRYNNDGDWETLYELPLDWEDVCTVWADPPVSGLDTETVSFTVSLNPPYNQKNIVATTFYVSTMADSSFPDGEYRIWFKDYYLDWIGDGGSEIKYRGLPGGAVTWLKLEDYFESPIPLCVHLEKTTGTITLSFFRESTTEE